MFTASLLRLAPPFCNAQNAQRYRPAMDDAYTLGIKVYPFSMAFWASCWSSSTLMPCNEHEVGRKVDGTRQTVRHGVVVSEKPCSRMGINCSMGSP